MTSGRFLTATVAGGVTLFILGYLIWGLAFLSFYEAHAGTASGVPKEVPGFAFLFVGQLVFAGFLTVVIGNWVGASGFGPAAKIGAIVGLLVALSYDLTFYGTTNIWDLTATLVDPVLSAVWSGLGAGVIGIVLARGSASG